MSQSKTASELQFMKMTETPIPKLITSLAIPTIISMLVTSIYNMADTFFVSKLGTSATGAVGIVFSLMAIIQAVGFTLGMGAGSLISRLMGQKKQEEAQEVASTSFFTAILFGLLLTFFGLVFIDPFMDLLGATDTILPYARGYARYILLGASIMSASFVLNNLLRCQGRAIYSMVGIGLGGVLNIALDPLFIFVLDLGISGAAIATLISQCISFSILLFFVCSDKSDVHIHLKSISRRPIIYAQIIKTGLPTLARQGLASAANIALNVNAAVYGDAAVAAMSVVGRIFMFIISAIIGFGQGFQPVVGFNYGAKKYDRVREAYWFTVKVGTVFLTVMAVLGFFLAPQAIAIFRKDDAEVIAIGAFCMRAQCIFLPTQPFVVASNMLFQSIGKSWRATFLSAARQGIFFLPAIILLPMLLELTGVQIAQSAADALTFLVTVPFVISFFRELKKIS
ncbi:MAG: MATE family efflux transporter [Lachnospiraceae bacterium]|jgi:putative MATE family efflux protein|nr:MATE family efflux transporter [Lachnospiraceae bacterium]